MTDQQIVDNALIDEFIGNNTAVVLIPFEYELNDELPTSGKICTLGNVEDEVRLEIDRGVVNSGNVTLTAANYHNDWSRLMLAVEKIADTGKGGGLTYGLRNALIVANMDQAYKEIIEFINWYNKQGK